MKRHSANTGEVSEYTNPELPYYIIRTWGKHAHDINTFHWHQDFEFDLVLEGEIRIIINDDTITVPAGNGIFINSHTMHALINDDEADYIMVRFHPMLLTANGFIERTYVSPVSGNTDYPYVYLDDHLPWKKDVMEAIKRIYMFSAAGLDDMSLLATSTVYFIWYQIYRNMPVMDDNIRENTRMTSLKEMVGYIQKNYHANITLPDIADAANVSVSSASALFREIIHDSPYHYLLAFRLEQARIRLGSENHSVSEIALQCGLNDVSHFIRSFKTAYGVTPLQYRKNIRSA